ncbi:MAG: hypothetical protein Q8L98_08035 [Chlamydiales bacterium]|nr:hypothetical protein [Chlamydiales bacterium]
MEAIPCTIPQISSWQAIADYAKKPLPPKTLKILAVDMDFTLVHRVGFGSDKWLEFFQYANQKNGLPSHAYADWTQEVCGKVSYKACESPKTINSILNAFRESGWLVKVLTARSSISHKMTKRHLQEANLDLKLEDVIFTRYHKMFPKDVILTAWIKASVNLKLYDRMEVLFIDDSIVNCQHVARISRSIKSATVSCFEYIGVTAGANSIFSQEELEQVLVQLHAYHKGWSISKEYTQKQIDSAMQAFNISTIDPQTVYEACRSVADSGRLTLQDKRQEIAKIVVVASFALAVYCFLLFVTA